MNSAWPGFDRSSSSGSPRIRDIPKAGGLSGQILELLRYRGELERFEAAGTAAVPAPRLPWGGMHVDFSRLADPPM